MTLTVKKSALVGGAFVLGTLGFVLVEGWARGLWKPVNFAYQASAWATFSAVFMVIIATAALVSLRLLTWLSGKLRHPLSRLHVALAVVAMLVLLGFPLGWHFLFVFPASYAASALLAGVLAGRLAAAA